MAVRTTSGSRMYRELDVTSVVLVSAVLAALAIGVLVAYAACVSMFAVFRIHARQVRETRVAAMQRVSAAKS